MAIALGSNLGDRLGHLRAGLGGIRALGTVTAVSSLYETAPVGGPAGQGRYLNAVAVVETGLGPEELMATLLRLEEDRGRVRGERWGPRTLDLDVVAHRGPPVSAPTIEIPHRRAVERRFVLEPLTEVWPQAQVADGVTAQEALAALEKGGVFRWEGDWEVSVPRLGWIGSALVISQFVLIAVALIVAFATLGPVPVWLTVASLGLAFAGSGLVVSGALALGRNLSALPDPRPGSALTERVIFRQVRHPIYGGVMIGSLGLVAMAGSWWALLPVSMLVAVLMVKSRLEERALTLAFPDYPDYAARVRRRFIPYVW